MQMFMIFFKVTSFHVFSLITDSMKAVVLVRSNVTVFFDK